MSTVVASRRRPIGLPNGVVPLLAALISLVAAALVWVDAPVGPRLPIGLLAVLLLPGYGLSLLVFPEPGELSWIERLALSFGLSLAAVAALALALHHTQWGLASRPFVIAVTGFSVVVTVAAELRRRHLATGWRASDPVGWQSIGRGGWAALAVAFATASFAIVALVVVATEPAPPLTEFFMLGPNGLVEQYPRAAEPGQVIAITTGITNRERATVSYRLAVQEGAHTLATDGPITVAPGETWMGTISFALPHAGKDQTISITLFVDGASRPYRTLRLWIDGTDVRTDEAGPPLATPDRFGNG